MITNEQRKAMFAEIKKHEEEKEMQLKNTKKLSDVVE